MSMTLEEARIELQAMKDTFEEYEPGGSRCQMALKVALSALRPVSREQVEKVWRGEWEDMREAYKDVPKRRCSRCKNVFIGLDTPFCEVCGAPMTDEAVEITLQRLEALHENDR